MNEATRAYILEHYSVLKLRAIESLSSSDRSGTVTLNAKGLQCKAVLEDVMVAGSDSQLWAINEALREVDFDLHQLNNAKEA